MWSILPWLCVVYNKYGTTVQFGECAPIKDICVVMIFVLRVIINGRLAQSEITVRGKINMTRVSAWYIFFSYICFLEAWIRLELHFVCHSVCMLFGHYRCLLHKTFSFRGENKTDIIWQLQSPVSIISLLTLPVYNREKRRKKKKGNFSQVKSVMQ